MKALAPILTVLVLLSLVTGCSGISVSVTVEPTSTLQPTDTPAPTVTLTPTVTPIPPTRTPNPTKTATHTSTPTPTNTPTLTPTETPTPTPISVKIIPEIVVVAIFNDPQAATWALLERTAPGFQASTLEDTTIVVSINEIDFTFTGEEAIEQIGKYKGLLVDYNESLFRDSEILHTTVEIVDKDGSSISKMSEEVINWDVVGVVPLPVDLTKRTEAGLPRFIVYHLDDMLPTDELLSSFDEYYLPGYIEGSRWIGGVEQNHSNAIDIGYPDIFDSTRTIVNAPKDMILKRTNCWPDPGDPKLTTCNFAFELPVSALVLEPNGDYLLTCQLEYVWGHMTLSPKDLPNYDEMFNADRVEVEEGTPLGVMEMRGTANAEIHAGIICPRCIGASRCDPGWPANDPHSLILPASMFFSPSDRVLILESVKETRP